MIGSARSRPPSPCSSFPPSRRPHTKIDTLTKNHRATTDSNEANRLPHFICYTPDPHPKLDFITRGRPTVLGIFWRGVFFFIWGNKPYPVRAEAWLGLGRAIAKTVCTVRHVVNQLETAVHRDRQTQTGSNLCHVVINFYGR